MKFDFLNGSNGEQSSKRLFALILIALFVVYFFANLFTGRILNPTLADHLFYLIITFFAGVTLEKPINNLGKKIIVPEEPGKDAS